jgi:hypothetical protein
MILIFLKTLIINLLLFRDSRILAKIIIKGDRKMNALENMHIHLCYFLLIIQFFPAAS